MSHLGPARARRVRAPWLNDPITKSLFLLRHAKSSWDDETLSDHERPLSHRGRRDARLLADHFVQAAIRPELVLCSTAVRAQRTLAPISTAVGLERQTRLESDLYGASAAHLLERVRAVDGAVSSALVVGHNPGLQNLALYLAVTDSAAGVGLREKFPTGALAAVALDSDSWLDLSPESAQVIWLTVPRDLRR